MVINFLFVLQNSKFGMKDEHDQIPDQYNILINGQKKTWDDKTISYSQIVDLAFPTSHSDSIFVVQYSQGPKENPEGTLVTGKEVETASGMVFDVTRTDKS